MCMTAIRKCGTPLGRTVEAEVVQVTVPHEGDPSMPSFAGSPAGLLAAAVPTPV